MNENGDKTNRAGAPGVTSVVVRARDEARYIERLLRDVRAQTREEIEIIVVDSGSTDGTVEIAERLADRVVRLAPEEFTFGHSLNLGCAAARGEFLVFVSAHTYPVSNNWLRNLVAPFADPRVAMVYGRQLPHPGARLDEERDLLANFGPHARVSFDDPVGPNNANAAVRRELWAQMPFDEALSGLEDLDWAKRVQARGRAVYYAENAAIVHIHEESLGQIHRRFRREGQALRRIMPSHRLTPLGAVRRWLTSCLRDLEYGLANRGGRRLLAVPFARAAEFAGLLRGFRDEDERRSREARAGIAAGTGPVAVRISAPGEHALVEAEPPRPAAGEVAIRVGYVGVCRTDVEVADGTLAYYRNGRGRFPIVPGHEYSGVVEAMGAGVRGLRPGDRVVGECILGCGECDACAAGTPTGCERRRETGVLNKDGAYASRLTLPAPSVHRVPASVLLRHAALAEPLAVVAKASRLMQLDGESRVCVVGAGPIGQLAAQLFRLRGASVALVDRQEARLRPAADLDISTATSLDGPALANATHVLEATGNPAVLAPLLSGAAPGAVVCLLGVHLEDPEEHVEPAVLTGKRVFASLGADPVDWHSALAALGSGDLQLDELTASVMPLERYGEAWELCRAGEGLKQLLIVDRRLETL